MSGTFLGWVVFTLILVLSIMIAFLPARIAEKKGYSFWFYFIISLFFWWITFFIVLFLKDKSVDSAPPTVK